jgi:hypothetical protein
VAKNFAQLSSRDFFAAHTAVRVQIGQKLYEANIGLRTLAALGAARFYFFELAAEGGVGFAGWGRAGASEESCVGGFVENFAEHGHYGSECLPYCCDQLLA